MCMSNPILSDYTALYLGMNAYPKRFQENIIENTFKRKIAKTHC